MDQAVEAGMWRVLRGGQHRQQVAALAFPPHKDLEDSVGDKSEEGFISWTPLSHW
jgi:hypothetical protein